MNILKLYLFLVAFLMQREVDDIDHLFYRWNLATLNSINEGLNCAIDSSERELYDNRFSTIISIWQIESDSLNKESIRWKFLKQIGNDFNRKKKEWTVIEIMKSGERVRFTNYFIVYDNLRVKVVRYDYTDGIWVKKEVENKLGVKIGDFKIQRCELGCGRNSFDIIVTNFNSSSILQSTYFLNSTLPHKNKIDDIIFH